MPQIPSPAGIVTQREAWRLRPTLESPQPMVDSNAKTMIRDDWEISLRGTQTACASIQSQKQTCSSENISDKVIQNPWRCSFGQAWESSNLIWPQNCTKMHNPDSSAAAREISDCQQWSPEVWDASDYWYQPKCPEWPKNMKKTRWWPPGPLGVPENKEYKCPKVPTWNRQVWETSDQPKSKKLLKMSLNAPNDLYLTFIWPLRPWKVTGKVTGDHITSQHDQKTTSSPFLVSP